MATSNTPAPMDVDEQQAQEVAVITDRKLLEQFAEMAVMIPGDPGGGTEDILRKVLSAKTWDELNEPWEASDVDDILGLTLHIDSVTRRPSTFRSGLGVFLIVKMTDSRSGKEYVKTTGSVSVVGQLAWLYSQGATAVSVQWCKADRPSTSGYFPQHLKIMDAHIPAQATG